MLKKIGKWKIKVLETGSFWLDGGAMMGSVPKILWEKTNPPDNQNRIKNNALYRIVIALIYQKILGRKSFHYPYIRVLPKMSDLKNHC